MGTSEGAREGETERWGRRVERACGEGGGHGERG